MKTEAPPGPRDASHCGVHDEWQADDKQLAKPWDPAPQAQRHPSDLIDSLAERFEFSVGFSTLDVWFCTTWEERFQWLSGELKIAHLDPAFAERSTPIVWLEKPQNATYRKTLLIAPVDAMVVSKSERGSVKSWTLKPTETQSVSRWFDSYGDHYGTAFLELHQKLKDAAKTPLKTWQPELGRFL
ncbi:hypothetical protein [Botrimarina hoheduenensis]|uniref:Uncharacterized protein n=1 Tax=Botrimarina hoheduenensis TaxID=2528000 RepID=A0A5C5WGM0_9BACT|nr:hypothetical protein [Botrimarina hoheduenensis]TWT48932.1 hypothetical protein Pla111_07100 [Botrimarina hoheduenensis]